MSRARASDQPDELPGDRELPALPVANESSRRDRRVATNHAAQVDAALREHADHAPVGIVVIDAKTHVIRYANPAFQRMRHGDGAPETSEVVERALEGVLPRSAADRVLALLCDVEASTVSLREIDVESAAERDTSRWWRITILPVPNGGDDVVLQIANVTPEVEWRRSASQMVTDLREVNDQLLLASLREHDLREQAEAASDAKSIFLAMMSHELRTPLTAIIGYEELLADGITGPITNAQRSQLARIKASATHLLALIDEVLSLSRIEAGRELMQREPIDVSALMQTAAELVAPLVASKSLTFVLRPPGHRVTLDTDAVKARQILVNLLANAVKFTERGQITFAVRQSGDTLTFEVRDTRIGIAPENLERIFDAFWQVQQKAARRVGGTGLGLHVSRHLARILGGDLTVESPPGRGSTFRLTLPLDSAIGPTETS